MAQRQWSGWHIRMDEIFDTPVAVRPPKSGPVNWWRLVVLPPAAAGPPPPGSVSPEQRAAEQKRAAERKRAAEKKRAAEEKPPPTHRCRVSGCERTFATSTLRDAHSVECAGAAAPPPPPPPGVARGPSGIINAHPTTHVENTCWLSAATQALLACVPLRTALAQRAEQLAKAMPDGVGVQLARAAAHIWGSDPQPFQPIALHRSVGDRKHELRRSRQHDVTLATETLLGGLFDDFDAAGITGVNETINDLFETRMVDFKCCLGPTCGGQGEPGRDRERIRQPLLHPVTLPPDETQPVDLVTLLDVTTVTPQVMGANADRICDGRACDTCPPTDQACACPAAQRTRETGENGTCGCAHPGHRNRPYRETRHYWPPPAVCCVPLNRTGTRADGKPKKLHHKVRVPTDTFTLSHLFADPEHPLDVTAVHYRALAVIYHDGTDIRGAHHRTRAARNRTRAARWR